MVGAGSSDGESVEPGELSQSGIHDPNAEAAAERAVAHEQAAEDAKEESRIQREEAQESEERSQTGVDLDPTKAQDAKQQHAQTQRKGGSKPKSQQPAVTPEELADGFGKTRLDGYREGLKKLEEAQKPAPGQPMLAPPRRQGNDALSALNNAQEPGVFFKELPQGGGGGAEEEEDPELAEAVREAARLLREVKGVQRVGPGQNDEGSKVVLVVADRGFTDASLRSVPERVHRFATLLAIPYELLPLRRAML